MHPLIVTSSRDQGVWIVITGSGSNPLAQLPHGDDFVAYYDIVAFIKFSGTEMLDL